eukprot:m.371298 g.371298  ORF g.371298 m.371298 type:complete len:57 (-) comp58119_c0_seq1:11-181(-)
MSCYRVTDTSDVTLCSVTLCGPVLNTTCIVYLNSIVIDFIWFNPQFDLPSNTSGLC